jgi:hypothetical protein
MRVLLTNIFCDLGGMIAAALYGNIGIKVIYSNVLMELFREFLSYNG